MKFGYYVFDLDNCLLKIPDPSNYFNNILIKSLKKLNSKIIPNESERVQFWTSGPDYPKVLKKWGVNEPNRFWHTFDEVDFTNRKLLLSKKKINLFDDVFQVLHELKQNNKKICLVSNTSETIIEHIFEEFDMGHFFHSIFGMGAKKDESLAKPSPEGIKQVLEEVNYNLRKSKDAIMVGDSYVDIFAAKRADIHACLIKRDFDKYPDGYADWEYKPDTIIKDLKAILDL